MSKQLDDLLFLIRQHPAKDEILKGPGLPEPKDYRSGHEPMQWAADHIFRSGRRLQDESWRQFLIGEPTSDKEKS